MFYSPAVNWCLSRVCSVSLAGVACLLYLAFWHSRSSYRREPGNKHPNYQQDELTHSQFAFVCYTLFVHTIALLFPFRLCFGTVSLTKSLRSSLKQNTPAQPIASRTNGDKHDPEVSPTSMEMEDKAGRQNVLHAIIIPNYKEDIETLRETLDVLACHSQAGSSYDVGY
jgi:hypothetical protein